MKVWQDWRDYRRFQNLPSRDRNIVFYSETHQDWHHLQPLIDFLIGPLARTVCHITSEPTVRLPAPREKGPHTFRIRSSVLCTWLFQTLEVAAAHPKDPSAPTTVLLAPTWGEQSTLHVCGEPLIAALLEAGLRVILRPHYQTARLAPRLVDSLVARFRTHPQFRHVDRMEESASLLESDLLVCDWSAMAIEYALGLGKPVLFVDVPPRVRNPNYAELGLEPMEMRIRRELGAVLPLDRLADAPRRVAELLRGAGEFRQRTAALREAWAFNFGRSVEVGAREISRIANERGGAGVSGAPVRTGRRQGG